MLTLTQIDGNPIIIDETKIFVAYLKDGKVYITMSNGFTSEHSFILKGECWADIVLAQNSISTKNTTNGTYNFYLGTQESEGYAKIVDYIGNYTTLIDLYKTHPGKLVEAVKNFFINKNTSVSAVYVLKEFTNTQQHLINGTIVCYDYDNSAINKAMLVEIYTSDENRTTIMTDGQPLP